MPALSTMQDLLVDELKDIYSAEKQLLEVIPRMARAASTPSLERALSAHGQQTEQQIQRLEHIFETLGERPTGKKCKGMDGLVREGAEALGGGGDGPVRDAHIISAAQRAEHYEISAYGTAVAHAEVLGHEEIARLLRETLDEERAADQKLTGIAEAEVIPAAVNGSADTPSRSAR